MTLYVSELIKPEELFPILNEYELGLEVTKFSMGDVIDNSEINCKEFKKQLINYEFTNKISFHGPYCDLVPASFDSKIKKATSERFNSVYDIAKKFNSEHIVFHTGFIPKMHYPDYWLEKSITFWKEFIENKENIEILIENVLEDDFMPIFELVEEINHPNFSVCLDIGHANACSSKGIENWIKGLNKKIKHVHLHNNDGIHDNHNGLQTGNINILNTLECLNTFCPNASWTLEVFNKVDIIESIKVLKNNRFL